MATEEHIKKMVDTLRGKFPDLEEDAYLSAAERIYEIGAQGEALEITCKGGEIVVTQVEDDEEPGAEEPSLSRQYFRQRREVRKFFQHLRQKERYTDEQAYHACCDRFGDEVVQEHLD